MDELLPPPGQEAVDVVLDERTVLTGRQAVADEHGIQVVAEARAWH